MREMTMKTIKRSTGALAATLALAWATGVSAQVPYDPFVMDAQLESGSGAITSPLESIGGTNFTATSIYEAAPGDLPTAGTTVIDTNRPDLLTSLGAPVDYSRQGRNFSSLSFDDALLDNSGGFTDGSSGGVNPWGTVFNDITSWGLTIDYDLTGTYLGLDPGTNQPLVNFTSGTFDLFFHNEGWSGDSETAFNTARADSIQVLSLELTESIGQLGNIILVGAVNFDFLDAGGFTAAEEAFIKSFFVDADTGLPFYDLIGEESAPLIEVLWRLDTNIDTAGNFADQLIDASVEGNRYRTTDLNATLRFESIPEPGTLALMGTALALLGGMIALGNRRRRDHY